MALVCKSCSHEDHSGGKCKHVVSRDASGAHAVCGCRKCVPVAHDAHLCTCGHARHEAGGCHKKVRAVGGMMCLCQCDRDERAKQNVLYESVQQDAPADSPDTPDTIETARLPPLPAAVGRKDDAGKPDYTLIPWDGMEPVVRVLEYGVRKYARDNWRDVPDSTQRYRAALMRHVIAAVNDEDNDPETGLPHLAHAVCCALFLLGKRSKP